MSNTVAETGIFEGTEDVSVAFSSLLSKIFKKSDARRPSKK
jgi:hypothetical protein